jgi:bifunctional enzyme CysN/CysC
LLVDPCPVVEICVTDDKESEDRFDLKLSIAETEKEVEAANTVYKYLKDKKILTGHNYSI